MPNGHFIINDGGHSYNLADLITYLQNIVSDRTDPSIYIDAWIISHLHVDHSGVFAGFNETYSGQIYVDAVYLSEPNKQTLKLESSLQGQIEDEYKGISMLKKADGKTATDIYRFQTGQRYFFSGMIMDVIQTQDQLSLNATTKQYDNISYSDYDEGQFNSTSTSLLYTMNVGEKFYIGGDANYANDIYITTAYGTASKLLVNIDVFVAPHHGLNLKETFCKYLLQSGKFDVVLFPARKVYYYSSISGSGTRVADNNFNQKFLSWIRYRTYTGSVSHYGNGPVVLTQGTDF